MTTIAYDHKNNMIAIDGRESTSRTISTDNAIKWRENDKGLWFFCGAPDDYQEFIDNFEHRKETRKLDVDGFFVSKGDDEIFNVDKGDVYQVGIRDGFFYWYELTHSFTFGSGDDFAIAALDFGRSAKEAVEYAATRDFRTGGKITVFDVESMEFL